MAISGLIPLGLGNESGRIEPVLASAPEGNWVLSLGVESTRTAYLLIGDRISYSQEIFRDSSNALSLRGFVRGSARMPVISAVTEPFALADGQTIIIDADRETQVISIDASDFGSVGSATAQELVTVFRRDLSSEIYADATIGGNVRLVSTQSGRQTMIEISGTAPLTWIYPVWQLFIEVDAIRLYERVINPGTEWSLTDILVRLDDTSPTSDYVLGLEIIERVGIVPALEEVTEYLIPAVYIDDLIFLEIPEKDGVVANRIPEPGEPILIPGTFQMDFLRDPIIPFPDIGISTNGGPSVPALVSKIFQSPWDGPLSIIIERASTQFTVVFDPTTELPSEAVLTVTTDPEFSPSIFDLVAEDIFGPDMIEIRPRSKSAIEVTFSEAVDDTALDISAYAVIPISLPAVTPDIVSATRLTPETILLGFDELTSIGRTYALEVVSVDDLNGNDSGPLRSEFVAWIPPETPDDRAFDLIGFLPEFNRIDLDGIGDLRRFVGCIQEVTDTILCQIDKFVEYIDPDRAPDDVLDLMLYDLSNPFAFELGTTDKRKLVKTLVEIFRGKGTAPGIIDAARFFTNIEITIDVLNDDDDGWVLGWSELGINSLLGTGTQALLYTFDIISPVTLTETERTRICDIAEYMKPAHTHKRALVEPIDIGPVDPMELGLSELGFDWLLH
jgi:phage tail-like protein